MKRENIISLFKEKNFRATPQRIAVYEYVYENRNHPDVLAVYENVKKKYPAFSKTTVYNALKALEKNGFIIPVTIDDERVRYDADTGLHGHFICNICRKIYDFETSQPKITGLEDFLISSKNVYYSGVCPCCKDK